MRAFTVLGVFFVLAAVACERGTPQSVTGLGGILERSVPSFVGSDCPPGFTKTSVPPGTSADRNHDGFVCTKTVEGTTVTIDNNATQPPRRKP